MTFIVVYRRCVIDIILYNTNDTFLIQKDMERRRGKEGEGEREEERYRGPK